MIAGRVLRIDVNQMMEDVLTLGGGASKINVDTRVTAEMQMIDRGEMINGVMGSHCLIGEGVLVNVRKNAAGRYDVTVLRPGGSLMKTADVDEFGMLSFIQDGVEQSEEPPF